MLETLRIFVDLVETESFTRAATMNYLTQSAISQRVHLLENEIGQQLVMRGRGHVTPTEAGKVFYQASKDILDRYEVAKDQLDRLRDHVSGKVRLGTITSVGLHELPPYVKVFLKRFPSVDLNLVYMSNRDIYQGLLDHTLDLGIVAYPAKHPQVIARVLRHDQLILITPPSHPLARYKSIQIGKLDGQPFVSYEIGIPTRRMIDRKLRKAGIKVRIVHEFDNVETIKRAVEIGAGIAIVPKKTVEREVASESLAGVTVKGDGWQRPLAILRRKGRKLSVAAQKFMDTVHEEL